MMCFRFCSDENRMRPASVFRVTIFVLIGVLLQNSVADSQVRPSLLSEKLRSRVEEGLGAGTLAVGRARIHALQTLAKFYENRGFRAAWVSDDKTLPGAEDLIRAVEDAGAEGLRSRDYHLSDIKAMLGRLRADGNAERIQIAEILADLELLLTDTYLLFGSHCLAGRLSPETIDPE